MDKFTEQANALVDSDLSEAHVDVQSLAATYKARRDAEDRHAGIYARALVKRALSAGVAVPGGYDDRKVDDLRAEISRRNEGRDEDDRIVPDGAKKADLIAALEADDARG